MEVDEYEDMNSGPFESSDITMLEAMDTADDDDCTWEYDLTYDSFEEGLFSEIKIISSTEIFQ
jgi:hypothetical protein